MKKLVLFVFILSFSFSACDKDFEEINRNLLKPTEVKYEALFNELVKSLQLGWNHQLFINNEILYDVTELGVVTAQTFGNVDSGAEDIWGNYYRALKNARELKRRLDELTREDPAGGDLVKAQVDILMAYKTFQLIDLFGDVPYIDAGKAFATEDVIRPSYDDDEEIYRSLLQDLKEASATLINSTGSTEAGNPYLNLGDFDALFGDNLSMWTKFSNSLQLKYLVRIYEQDKEFVNEEVEFILTNGYDFISPGEDILMSPAEQGWSNLGVNWSFREHNKLRMGSTLWGFMTDDDEEILDPRAGVFFEPNNNGEWVAFPQISNANTPQSGGDPYNKDSRDGVYENKGEENIYSSFNFYLVRDEKDVPEILLTAADVKFLLAEVFLRGIGTTPDPFIASFRYQEGMLTSIEFWQDIVSNSLAWENKPNLFSSGEIFAVTEHPKYKINTDGSEEEALRKIYTQRWVNYFRQPWEAFSLLRQTDLLPREKAPNDFFRLRYPTSESLYNTENWNAQVAKMGADETNVKVWWME